MKLTSLFAPLGVTSLTLLAIACTTASTRTDDAPGAPAVPAVDGGGSTGTTATCPTTTTGPTVHTGDIEGDETWTAEASPHIVRGDVHVREGRKLTIAPCAVVQLESASNLDVAFPLTPGQGSLVAEGTADRPIRFQGKDGARWGHINVVAPGTARFAYVTFEDGGGGETRGHETIYATGDGTFGRKPLLFVDHVTIKGSRGAGIRLDTGAAFAPGSKDLTITGSGENNEFHPYPLDLGEAAIDTIPTGTYTGNRKDEILIMPETVDGAGGFQEDTTMYDRGVPYHVSDAADHDDLMIGTGSKDAILTVEPGVKILFEKTAALIIETHGAGTSSIVARGTKAKPIVFTSAATSPAPGDWRGFYFNGPVAPKNALENVRIEYTGSDCSCSMVTCSAGVTEFEAAIIFEEEPRSMFMKDSVIAHGSGNGVVQGYDGLSYDWKGSGNVFEDIALCSVTEPRNPSTACPDPMPPCK